MVREGVTQEVDVLACDLAGENMAVLFLAAAEELERVSPELQRTTQVGNEAILDCRLTRLPMGIDKQESRQYLVQSQNKLPLIEVAHLQNCLLMCTVLVTLNCINK